MSIGVVISLPFTVKSMLAETPSTVAVTVAVFLFKDDAPPASLALTIPFS